MTDINELPDHERIDDEVSARIIEKAKEIFAAEMPEKGELTDQSLRVQNVYMMAGREALLNDYVGSVETVSDTEISNKLELVNNTPDMFVFAFGDGQEFLRIFRDNHGNVDVEVDPRMTYTEAASAFTQVIFQNSAKQQNLNFSRAFELMMQGHKVELFNGSLAYHIENDCLMATDKESGEKAPLSELTDILILSRDWQLSN